MNIRLFWIKNVLQHKTYDTSSQDEKYVNNFACYFDNFMHKLPIYPKFNMDFHTLYYFTIPHMCPFYLLK